VIVADNLSHDDSVARLREAIASHGWSGWVDLMPLDSNRGFGAGNNAAIRTILNQSPPVDLIYLLNPDTIARPGAIRFLREFLERHPHVAMAGGRLEEPDGEPQTSAFRFPNLPAQVDGALRLGFVSKRLKNFLTPMAPATEPHPADWLTGASMMIRRQVFERIGFFDEGYFLYFEEVDFCLRARRKGMVGWHVPASRVVHLEGKSTGVSASQRKLRPMPRYWFDSRRRYFRKNHGWLMLLLANLAFLVPFLFYRLRRRIQRKEESDPPRFLWDFVRYSF
jgi:N-acetylglucosaminyl-diphospho-decaprenol L-rhamnosyltransferase